MSTVYIAFGANLGDRRSNIEAALAALASIAADDIEVSSLWESAPHGMDPQAGDFLNGVVRLQSDLEPRALLEALQSIEARQGRPRSHVPNEPRPIDLDIVCIDQLIVDEPDLVVPHPRARERRFVLAPLAELAPALVLPGESATVTELRDAAPPMAIRRLSDDA